MSEQCKRTCGACRSFTRDPDRKHVGVCWKCYTGDGAGNDCYLSVHDGMNACGKWESVTSGPVGGEVVFVSSCDRDALLELADEIEGLEGFVQCQYFKAPISDECEGCRAYGKGDYCGDLMKTEIANRIREACGEVE